MPILVVCECGARIRAADKLAGRAMFCPQCMNRIVIPAPVRQPAAAARVAPRTAPARPDARPPAPARPTPVTETVAEIDDEIDTPAPRARSTARADAPPPRPRRKKRRKFAAKGSTRRRISPLAWAGVGGAALLVVGTVWGTVRLLQGVTPAPRAAIPVAGAAVADTENKVTAQDLLVSAHDLLEAYQNNDAEADRRYQGGLLAVTGWVARLARDGENHLFVEVKGSKKLESFTVKCLFRFRNEGEVASLQPGQALMIKGRCDGKQGDNATGNVILKDCRFVKFVVDTSNTRHSIIREAGP